jgi:hypothetical protein
MTHGWLTPYLEWLRAEGSASEEMRSSPWQGQESPQLGILTPYLTKRGIRTPLPDEILWHVTGSADAISPALGDAGAPAIAPRVDPDTLHRRALRGAIGDHDAFGRADGLPAPGRFPGHEGHSFVGGLVPGIHALAVGQNIDSWDNLGSGAESESTSVEWAPGAGSKSTAPTWRDDSAVRMPLPAHIPDIGYRAGAAQGLEFERRQEFAPHDYPQQNRTVAFPGVATGVLASHDNLGFGPGTNTEIGGSDARRQDRAQAEIYADPELLRDMAIVGFVGEQNVRGRVASIIADLESDPATAFDAVRGEVFASQMRNRLGPTLANAAVAYGLPKVFERLATLRPGLGIAEAIQEGRRAAAEFDESQKWYVYSVQANPRLSIDEKMQRLHDAGVVDPVLAATLIGLFGLSVRGVPSASADARAVRSESVDALALRRMVKKSGPRYDAGVATGAGTSVEGKWFTKRFEGPIPAVVAAMLKGREFRTFDDYRAAVWRAVASIEALVAQFTVQNGILMRQGLAPVAPRRQHGWGSRVFQLHHMHEISKGGPVYDADNIAVVSPLRHYLIHLERFGRPPQLRQEDRMGRKLTRDELVEVARKLMTADVSSDAEVNRLAGVFNRNVPHPGGTDLIFYPEIEFETPEQVVDYALAYTNPKG